MLSALNINGSVKIKEFKTTRDHTEKMIEYCGGKIDIQNSSKGKIITLHNQFKKSCIR